MQTYAYLGESILKLFTLINFGFGISKEINSLIKNKDVRIRYFQIKRIFGWFEEVREIINVIRHSSGNEQDNEPVVIRPVGYAKDMG